MIYFIGDIEANVCKIGFSRKPYRRIETLRGQSPYKLEIFDIIDGDFTDEKFLHSKYFASRLNGEWFRLSDVLDLGFSRDIKKITIGDINININPKNNYIHLSSLISCLNGNRCKLKMNYINFSVWRKTNTDFLNTINNPIIKETCIWIHPYIAFELIRDSTVKNKITLYENFYNNKELREFCSSLKS